MHFCRDIGVLLFFTCKELAPIIHVVQEFLLVFLTDGNAWLFLPRERAEVCNWLCSFTF